MCSIVRSLERELKRELPGITAHQMLMPERIVQEQHKKKVDACVLALIYPNSQNQYTIVFIRRPLYNGHHSGQVSFPGGKVEKSDTSFEHTALRETEEEIGVNPTSIKIIGKLSDLYITISNFLVHPYVGYTNSTPKFFLDKNEVEYIIEYPLFELLNLETKLERQ